MEEVEHGSACIDNWHTVALQLWDQQKCFDKPEITREKKKNRNSEPQTAASMPLLIGFATILQTIAYYCMPSLKCTLSYALTLLESFEK